MSAGEHARVSVIERGQTFRCWDCDARWDANDAPPSECVPADPALYEPYGKSPAQLAEPFVASLEELAKDVDLTPGSVSYALQKDRDNPPAYVSPYDAEEPLEVVVRIAQQFRDAEARLGGSIEDMVPEYRSPRGVGRVYPAHPTTVAIEVRDLRALAEKYGL